MKNNWAAKIVRILRNRQKPVISRAFTLAEVLITLAIIGVVASITIPSLMQSTQNQETVAKVKKTYSTISAAYERSVVDNGSADDWGWTGGGGPNHVLTILAPYLKITKNCGTSTGCLPDVTYKALSNIDDENIERDNSYAKAILADGTLFSVVSCSTNCNDSGTEGDANRGSTPSLSHVCGIVDFDVNGKNPPNQYGKDTFSFYITKYGIVPVGTINETYHPPGECNKSNFGTACTAWVIQKGNMDYLK